MNDYLVSLGKHQAVRQMIQSIGLPLSLPIELKRSENPWEERPLSTLSVLIGQIQQSEMTPVIAKTLVKSGAFPYLLVKDESYKIFSDYGKAWSCLPQHVDMENISSKIEFHALIYDATELTQVEDLSQVYTFFHSSIKKLSSCGRVMVLVRNPTLCNDPAQAAASRSLEGFIRSIGREIGRKGATANLIIVDPEAELRVEPILNFILSQRAAYISGQPFHVSISIPGEESFPSIRPLDQKVALITGAARGIGAKTAEIMAREGAKVICLDRPEEDEAVSQLAGRINGMSLLCDVTSMDAPKTICNFILKHFNGINIVVHNAGITRDKTLARMNQNQWDLTIDVNLNSVIRMNQELIPLCSQGGRMIFLSSVAGIAGNVGQTNYSASKAGIIGYVQSLAKNLAFKGISVNAVAPGFIETQMTLKIPFATREVARRLCNLGQGGTPLDVAETITFLSSPGAIGLSGQIIRICGGHFIGA